MGGGVGDWVRGLGSGMRHRGWGLGDGVGTRSGTRERLLVIILPTSLSLPLSPYLSLTKAILPRRVRRMMPTPHAVASASAVGVVVAVHTVSTACSRHSKSSRCVHYNYEVQHRRFSTFNTSNRLSSCSRYSNSLGDVMLSMRWIQ